MTSRAELIAAAEDARQQVEYLRSRNLLTDMKGAEMTYAQLLAELDAYQD